MKKPIILSIFMLLGLSMTAQLFEISNDPVFRDESGSVKSLALAGGLNQPQFSAYDFNKDKKMDLFVFDRTGNKVLVFISESTPGKIKFRYDPSYEEFFPKGTEFMQLHDYDDDGNPDIWTYVSSSLGDGYDSVTLYRDESAGLLNFNRIKALYGFDKVQYVAWAPNKKLGNIKGCLPAIYDIDGDEDLDYISNLNLNGSSMQLFQNNSADKGLPLDSIAFDVVDNCYGGIAEDLNLGKLTINSECGFKREGYMKKKKHSAAKTIMFLDGDGDGDSDLFFGSSERSTNPIYYFENAKSDLSYYKDTFIRIDTAYFSQSVESQIPVSPGMFYLDIDMDGVKDLILSTNDLDRSAYPIQEIDNVLLFLNKDATDDPDLRFEKNDFLVGDMIDLGGRTAPTFGDLDGDGDQDLIIATTGNHYITGDTTDYLVYYENIGSSNNPDFKLISSDYLSLKSLNLRHIAPTLIDIDDDNDLDLFFGKQDGTISFYSNEGTMSSPSFSWKTDTFADISSNLNVAPTFFDLNKDGKLDLLTGQYNGTIGYYENTGTSVNPAFSLVTDKLGNINVSEMVWQVYTNAQDEPYDTFVHLQKGSSAPQIISYGDDVCLAIGSEEGYIRLYQVNTDLTANFTEVKDYMKRDYVHTSYSKDWGKATVPAVSDINADGFIDILIGNERGGFHYIKGKQEIVGINDVSKEQVSFNIVPNPTNGSFTLYAPSNNPLSYSIISLNGQLVASGTTISGSEISVANELSNGLYFVSLSDGQQIFATQKLVVSK